MGVGWPTVNKCPWRLRRERTQGQPIGVAEGFVRSFDGAVSVEGKGRIVGGANPLGHRENGIKIMGRKGKIRG